MALVDDVRAFPGRVAMACGTGALMGTDGVLVEWLRWVLLILTGSLDRPGGMRFPRGAAEPPAATAVRRRGRRPRAPPAGPSCPAWSRAGAGRSRSPTRSKRATSACWS